MTRLVRVCQPRRFYRGGVIRGLPIRCDGSYAAVLGQLGGRSGRSWVVAVYQWAEVRARRAEPKRGSCLRERNASRAILTRPLSIVELEHCIKKK